MADFIRVARDRFHFTHADGRVFAPMGAFYLDDRHPEIDPLNWWDHQRPERLEHDFTLAARLGCNTLRMVWTLSALNSDPTNPAVGSPLDWKRCQNIVDTAKRHSLRLYIDIRVRDRVLQDNTHLPFYVQAFTEAARRFRDDPTIFCWDLDAEGICLVGYPGDRALWDLFLDTRYRTHADNARAWGVSMKQADREAVWNRWVGALNHQADVDPVRGVKPARSYLDHLNAPGDPTLADWQEYRGWLYARKLLSIAQAIRRVDRNHLICVDLILFAFPLFRNELAAGYGGPYGWSGNELKRLSAFVDFIGFHTYPVYIPPFTTEWYETLTRDPNMKRRQLRFLETAVRCVRVNTQKPVVLSETGWHGGKNDWQGNTAEQQRDWNLALIEQTRGCAVGWINWTLKDVPTHEGITQTGGLVGPDIRTRPDTDDQNPLSPYLYAGELPSDQADQIKPWGAVFPHVVERAHRYPAAPRPGRRVSLCQRRLLTAVCRTLDRQLRQLMEHPDYPVDIVLTP